RFRATRCASRERCHERAPSVGIAASRGDGSSLGSQQESVALIPALLLAEGSSATPPPTGQAGSGPPPTSRATLHLHGLKPCRWSPLSHRRVASTARDPGA